jgi:hypothetical protein
MIRSQSIKKKARSIITIISSIKRRMKNAYAKKNISSKNAHTSSNSIEKENKRRTKNVRNEMRDQTKKRLMIYRVISKIIDTNILNELDDLYAKKNSKNENTSSTTELKASSSFRFENMITSSYMNEIHLLYKSVIYDSECSDSFTYDRNRFVNEIRSADK